MLRDDWPRNRKESQTPTLAAELALGAYVEKREVARDQVMRDTRCLVQDIDLS
jgi:hypothetical protein